MVLEDSVAGYRDGESHGVGDWLLVGDWSWCTVYSGVVGAGRSPFPAGVGSFSKETHETV